MVTTSLLLAFAVQIRKPTPDVVHNYFKLIPGAAFDPKANEEAHVAVGPTTAVVTFVEYLFIFYNVAEKILVNVQ